MEKWKKVEKGGAETKEGERKGWGGAQGSITFPADFRI